MLPVVFFAVAGGANVAAEHGSGRRGWRRLGLGGRPRCHTSPVGVAQAVQVARVIGLRGGAGVGPAPVAVGLPILGARAIVAGFAAGESAPPSGSGARFQKTAPCRRTSRCRSSTTRLYGASIPTATARRGPGCARTTSSGGDRTSRSGRRRPWVALRAAGGGRGLVLPAERAQLREVLVLHARSIAAGWERGTERGWEGAGLVAVEGGEEGVWCV